MSGPGESVVMSAPPELVAFRQYVQTHADPAVPFWLAAGRGGVTLHIHKLPDTATLNAILVFLQNVLAQPTPDAEGGAG